jgi:sulfur carrier protein ThiS
MTKHNVPQPVYEPQDKVVAKVATLFGILEQLGFRSERIANYFRETHSFRPTHDVAFVPSERGKSLGHAALVLEMPQPVYEPQDKVVAKVATLFGILEQLGFRSERIEECIRKVKTLEIEDCLDWVRLVIHGLPRSAHYELISRMTSGSCTSTPTPTSCEGKEKASWAEKNPWRGSAAATALLPSCCSCRSRSEYPAAH